MDLTWIVLTCERNECRSCHDVADLLLLHRENNYGLTRDNFEEILKNLDHLRHYVHVWPPQDQPNTIGSKLQSIQNLDIIASRRTHSTRPITRELKVHEQIPDNIVIKRTHSDSGIHILLPGDRNRNWEYMLAHSEIPRCRWFGQTYVETLHRLGEWRTFVVGGKIIYTVHTFQNSHRDTWKWDMVREYYSLQELRYGEFFSIILVRLLIYNTVSLATYMPKEPFLPLMYPTRTMGIILLAAMQKRNSNHLYWTHTMNFTR